MSEIILGRKYWNPSLNYMFTPTFIGDERVFGKYRYKEYGRVCEGSFELSKFFDKWELVREYTTVTSFKFIRVLKHDISGDHLSKSFGTLADAEKARKDDIEMYGELYFFSEIKQEDFKIEIV